MKHPNRYVALAALAGVLLAGGLALRGPLTQARWLAETLRDPLRLVSRATPTGPVVLEQVQRLQRLETSRYQGQVIVRGDTSGLLPSWLAGDRLLFIGRGEVVAGVDLAALRPEDVRVDGARVSLRLPKPEVLYTRLDNRESQVYERRAGLLTGPDAGLEGRVRAEAEERIRLAAVESGILRSAEANSRDTLRRQLELLGFRDIRFL
jgi:hypothetical protein